MPISSTGMELLGEFIVSLVFQKSGSPWHSLKFSSKIGSTILISQRQLLVEGFLFTQPSPSAKMTTKMKGLLKGLRYISQIFDSEKEQEMQIGYPTDVKHLAHIGWDGPSANSPSWLKEFKITPGSPGVLNSVGEVNSPAKSSTKDSLLRDITKMHKSSGAPLDSPTRCSTSKTKQSRRHHSSNGSVGLKAQESSGFSKSRQPKNSLPDLLNRDSSYSPRQNQKSNIGLESPYPDPPASPKPSHQTNSEGSSDGGVSTNYQDLKVRIH